MKAKLLSAFSGFGPRKRSLVVASCLALIFLLYVFSALGIRKHAISHAAFGPGFYPAMIGIMAFGLLALIAFFDLQAIVKGKDATPKEGGKPEKNTQNRVVGLTILLIVAYIATLDFLGFIVGTFLYLTLQICLLCPKKLGIRSIVLFGIVSAVFSAAVFFIFSEFFQLLLPSGILG